jgi:hypothetical protein
MNILEQLASGLLNYSRSEPEGLLARGMRQPAGLLGRGLNNAVNMQGPGLLQQQQAFFQPSVMNTPEQTRADGAAFLQNIASGPLGMAPMGMATWYKGMHPYDWTKEVQDAKGRVLDPGPIVDAKDINRTTPFPSFTQGEPDLRGIKGFFSSDPAVASHFALSNSKNGAVYPVDIDAARKLVLDAKGKKAGELQFGEGGKEFRNAVRSGSYDLIVLKNTADEGDIAVALKGANIKSVFE